MKVLVLSPYGQRISGAIAATGDTADFYEDRLQKPPEADFIVSYGYRHMVREPVLSAFKGRIINLHISMLPFNRGADPNFWSWINDTPKGVTIHEIDEGMDTGPVISQRSVIFSPSDTLATSYEKLRNSIEGLFADCWPQIRSGYRASPQTGDGSHHFAKDKDFLFNALPLGWNTPVVEIEEIGAMLRKSLLQSPLSSKRAYAAAIEKTPPLPSRVTDSE